MEDDFSKLKSKLEECGQEHILSFWNELDEDEKNSLKTQIENIDFRQIKNLYENSLKNQPFSMDTISPIPYFNSLEMSEQEKQNYTKTGEEVIKKRKVAVISMAGGQRNKAWLSRTKSYF